ncbi:MAG: disulfide bond formation protein B [Acidobacteria bacterium]|nr:disulfide bond formation protein B [Acidobacteriota bacterium]
MIVATTVSTLSFFFAALALLCWAAVVGIGVGAVVRRSRPGPTLESLRADLGRVALPLAWVIALVTMAGSLYYSRIEHYIPCELCWYQRICIYPFAVILGIAAWRRDAAVRVYAIPVLAIGAVVAAYHSWIQAFPPADGTSFCTPDAPCTMRYVWEFGFVSLPFMALSACAAMIVLLLIARPTPRPPLTTETP